MATVKARPASELEARRLTGADLLVAQWMLGRAYGVPRGGHWATCPADASLSTVDFGVGYGGGCSTCAYAFATAFLKVSCSCGGRTKTIEVNVNMGLAEVLAELISLAEAADMGAVTGIVADESIREGLESVVGAVEAAEQAIDEDKARYWAYGIDGDDDGD